jgi:hypothetical protein
MINKPDDELAELGWLYVARNHLGNVASVTSEDDADHVELIMEWLSYGYTVAKLFK